MAIGSVTPGPVPADTEARMNDFAELVATAIANAATRHELQGSRDSLGVLATQQTALRRVATLVARGVNPAEVFSAVAEEMARCLNADNASVSRFDGETLLILALARMEAGMKNKPRVGESLSSAGDNIATRVFHTGRPARLRPSSTFGNSVSR